jgi:hypothetical protein
LGLLLVLLVSSEVVLLEADGGLVDLDNASVNAFFVLVVLVAPALDGAVAADLGLDLDDVSIDGR